MNYTRLSHAFAEVKDASARQVGRIIGGNVKNHTETGTCGNPCALRISYAINKAGGMINATDGAVCSGQDGKLYLHQSYDLLKYIERLAVKKITGKDISDLKGNSGIIVFGNSKWSNANGHMDLFNGYKTEGNGYRGIYSKVTLYIL